MRFDSPLQLFERTATEDVEIGGITVAAGQKIAALLGAANRDPAVFADPDRLDVGRADNPHISFGAGIHFCIGAPLARVELQATFGALLDRTSSLELGGEPVRRPEFVIRGLAELPVVLTPAASAAAIIGPPPSPWRGPTPGRSAGPLEGEPRHWQDPAMRGLDAGHAPDRRRDLPARRAALRRRHDRHQQPQRDHPGHLRGVGASAPASWAASSTRSASAPTAGSAPSAGTASATWSCTSPRRAPAGCCTRSTSGSSPSS